MYAAADDDDDQAGGCYFYYLLCSRFCSHVAVDAVQIDHRRRLVVVHCDDIHDRIDNLSLFLDLKTLEVE